MAYGKYSGTDEGIVEIVKAFNQELQELKNKLVERAGAYATEISTEKSKVMVNSIKSTTTNIIMRGHKLEEVEGFKYLGATLSKDGSGTAEIRIRIATATAVFYGIHVWRKCKPLHLRYLSLLPLFPDDATSMSWGIVIHKDEIGPVLLMQKHNDWINGVIQIVLACHRISTYCKKCSSCGMFYRYQDWMHGLHNFNYKVLLSIFLCIFIRNSVQDHVAVGRVRSILQKTTHVPYPKETEFLHAYLHFEALTHHDYAFSCLKCGHHPPVVVMDLHKKGVFNMAVSDISEPTETFNGEVNSEEFWETLSRERIATGLLRIGDTNPYTLKPNYENWAPWIGRHTCRSPSVINTEWKKVQTTNTLDNIAEIDMTEERLSDELMKLKHYALSDKFHEANSKDT
ncbi:uncharacterized protein LOC131531574 [Onychostoma macrolepis]|uniref:uncharacterized protein LOC131531574 n=1 Tax=Onychostoma macrolepis TaxID=369639 RepID=UPI00272BF6A2|nr:uncharacterized protein LOC131531574 [Onychostoma macrolepis]